MVMHIIIKQLLSRFSFCMVKVVHEQLNKDSPGAVSQPYAEPQKETPRQTEQLSRLHFLKNF